MIATWILVVALQGFREPTSFTIDHIATGAECERVQQLVSQTFRVQTSRCFQVWRAKT